MTLLAMHWVLAPTPLPRSARPTFDLAKVRALARASGGPLARRVQRLVVGESVKPMAAVLGGFRVDKYVMSWTSFQLIYPERTVVIDAPGPGANGGDPRFRALQRILRSADLILVTHEHPDHLGGIAHSPHLDELRDRVQLGIHQLRLRSGMARFRNARSIELDVAAQRFVGLHTSAPGLVVIPSPGHTPGSQMIFLLREDGTEFLFVGDIAWHRDQILLPRGRPRISRWLMGEDADAVGAQLLTLHELAAHEKVNLVISHDAHQLDAYVSSGLIHDGSPEEVALATPTEPQGRLE